MANTKSAPGTTTSYPGKYVGDKAKISPKAGPGPVTPGKGGNKGVASRIGK